MNRTIWLKRALELFLTLILGLSFFAPGSVQAHEGTGFHPEALWALLRTSGIVAAVFVAFVGVLWVYQWYRHRNVK